MDRVAWLSKWPQGLTLLLAIATGIALSGPAAAQAFRESIVQVGPWKIAAFASPPSRAFHLCSMQRQNDGSSVSVGLTAGGVQLFSVSLPRWDLQVKQTYPMSLSIGGQPFTFSATARSDSVMNLEASSEFFAALQSGQQLSIAANQRHFTADLGGIEAATARLKTCLKEFTGRTLAVPTSVTRPPEQAASPSPPASSDGAAKTVGMQTLVVRVNARPVYSEASRAAGEEGLILSKVKFNARGVPEMIIVDRSSGYRTLDTAATDALKDMRIEPFVDNGKPMPVWVVVPIRFQLQ